MPDQFIPAGSPQTKGVRQNLGVESGTTVGPYFYTGSEGALVQDGPAAAVGVQRPPLMGRQNVPRDQWLELGYECPHCGEEPVIEIRKRGEEDAAPAAAGSDEVGRQGVRSPEKQRP